MRIDRLEVAKPGRRVRISARVQWEQATRADQSVFFEWPQDLAGGESAPGDAFLLAALVPAYAVGERRISIDAPVCPLLRVQALDALRLLSIWQPDESGDWVPEIEAAAATDAPHAGTEAGAAALFSGGVDSMHLWLKNRDDFPASHPGRIRHLLPVYGFDLGGKRNKWESQRKLFESFVSDLRPLAARYGASVSPVYTNLRHLDDRSGFWGRWFVGAALAAVLTALRGGVATAYAATGGDPICATLQAPDSQNPIPMSLYSSTGLTVRMPYLSVPRQDRLMRVAREPDLLRALRVCFGNDRGLRNCGRCEKCVRTMLGLRLADVDERIAFAEQLTIARIEAVDIDNASVAVHWQQLASLCSDKRMDEFRHAIEGRLASWQRYSKWREGRTLGGRIRRLIGQSALGPSG